MRRCRRSGSRRSRANTAAPCRPVSRRSSPASTVGPETVASSQRVPTITVRLSSGSPASDSSTPRCSTVPSSEKKPAASRSKYGFSMLNTPAISFMFANAAQRTPASYCSVSQRRRRDVAVQRVVRRHRAFFQALGVAARRTPAARSRSTVAVAYLSHGSAARFRQHRGRRIDRLGIRRSSARRRSSRRRRPTAARTPRRTSAVSLRRATARRSRTPAARSSRPTPSCTGPTSITSSPP